MNELDKAVKDAMTAMLVKFNNRLSKFQMEPEEKLADWAEYLAFERKFKVSQVAVALESLMSSNTKFMPSAYEIADALKPKDLSSEEIGNFVANEVIQKVIEFGIYRLHEAFEALSDVSKKTIGENRYLLREISRSEESQLPTIRAQIRGLAKSVAESHKAASHNTKLARIGIASNEALQLPEGPKRVAFTVITQEGE